ncbi:MAG: glycosyl hydrolase 115 family protein, partial [Prevotella sp.]|nr:glycosyl hydrolase 115 family protein [Prevotella sp.]
MTRNHLIIILLLWLYSMHAFAFDLVKNDNAATLYYTGNELVVNTAIDLLINDSKLICQKPFSITGNPENNTIIIGIPGREPALKELTVKYGLDVSGLEGKWEAYKIQEIQQNGHSYLFVLGSDPRGTAYGVLELSRQMGVSPWVWWADVQPEKKTDVTFTADGQVHVPSVQYRGIFLNDEDWGLMPWATHTFEPTSRRGAIGPETYSKMFELMLRLRANVVCPAMHECTVPFYMVEGNKQAAERYGIIISTSHAEPMMRTNTGEWNSKERGPFNYFTNKDRILTYWDTRVQELTHSENIYTMGLRGIHDGRMQGVSSLDEETRTLEKVIAEQRNILKKNNPEKELNHIPQIFVPYKEVLEAYNNGLQLPDDITIVWCDDNHGHIMRLSDKEEQKRSGGAGVYYHISYWGKPHDYLWLASTQPGLIYSEMKRAWNHGARRYWVVNVGDLKPGEYLTEFFLDMAWDINSVSGNTIYSHQQNWIKNTFGN